VIRQTPPAAPLLLIKLGQSMEPGSSKPKQSAKPNIHSWTYGQLPCKSANKRYACNLDTVTESKDTGHQKAHSKSIHIYREPYQNWKGETSIVAQPFYFYPCVRFSTRTAVSTNRGKAASFVARSGKTQLRTKKNAQQHTQSYTATTQKST